MSSRRAFLTQTIAGISAAVSTPSVSETVVPRPVEQSPASITRYRIPRTDVSISRLGYGTGLGRLDSRSPNFVADAVRLYRIAYESGINFFDLANTYQDGRSEEALGALLKESPELRRRIVIQSKCGFCQNYQCIDLSREHIVSSTEGSLRRLGVDSLDILLLHFPDPLSEPTEIADGLDKLHRAGKVRFFGLSNYNVTQMELLKRYVRQPLVINQIQFGLGSCTALANTQPRSVGFGGIIDYCQLNEIQVQAYSPLQLISGISLLNPPPDAGKEVVDACETIKALGAVKNVGSDGIALAWVLRHPAKIVPIIGTSDAEHIRENCKADRVDLTRREWNDLYASARKILGLAWDW